VGGEAHASSPFLIVSGGFGKNRFPSWAGEIPFPGESGAQRQKHDLDGRSAQALPSLAAVDGRDIQAADIPRPGRTSPSGRFA